MNSESEFYKEMKKYMSTNYYLRNKKEYEHHSKVIEQRSKIIDEFMSQLADWNNDESLWSVRFKIEEIAHVGYEEIHIGKRSYGWKPLFQKQNQFSSFRELEQFYKSNQHIYEIIDECNRVHTWDELETELINWQGERENGDRSDNYKDNDGFTWARYEFS